MFSKKWFFDLDQTLRNAGLDSDQISFDEILSNLKNPKKLSPDEFAFYCVYVILAGGFSQKTAKKKHSEITKHIEKTGKNVHAADLLALFNNKNKINAIIKIWENRNDFCADYYLYGDPDSRINYLSKLPHIGKITANHLARNLGENIVKYDIWIQRLGVVYSGNKALGDKIDNGKLDPDIKKACDKMFTHLEKQTGLPRGYIDVVLWKACQNGFIKL